MADLNALIRFALGPTLPERLRDLAHAALLYSGLAWVLGHHRGATILLYHSVGGQGAFTDNVTSTDQFRREMQFLAEHCTPVSLHTILKTLENGGDIDPRWVAVTFDDGYRDFLDQALPILVELGIPATVFIATATLDGEVLFFDAIQRLLDRAQGRAGAVVLEGLNVAWDARSARRKAETALRLAMRVRELDPRARDKALASLEEAIGTTENVPRRQCYLDADQLATLPPNVDVGSHTVNHYNLAVLGDEQLSSELAASAETLSEVTRRPTEVLAYPFGKAWSYDDRVAHAARAAGYRAALTTAPGRVTVGSDPMSLPRVGAGHSLSRLRVNLMGVNL